MPTMSNAEREVVQPISPDEDRAPATPSSFTPMGELRKLARHSSHYLMALVASLSIGFISFPVYTRVFSVAEYGLIDFVQKILLLATAASKMGLQNSALRFYDAKEFRLHQDERTRYFSTMFLGTVLTAAVGTVLFAFGVRVAPAKMIDRPLAAVLLTASTLILIRAPQSVLLAFLRIEERTKSFAIVTVAMRACNVSAVCLLLFLIGRSARIYFVGVTAVEFLAVLVLTLILVHRRVLALAHFDSAFFRMCLMFGLPLIINEIAFIVLDAGDRVLVRHFLGAVALGHYSVAYGLSNYVNELLIVPLNLALVPIYMRLWTYNGRESTIQFLSKGLDIFMMSAAGLFAVTLVASRDGLIVLASTKYQSAAYLIPILVAGFLIYTTQVFLSAGLMIHKKTGTMAKLMACSAAVNLLLNWFLLPRMGLIAAALATVLSFALCVFLIWRAASDLLPLNLNFVALSKYVMAAATACGTAYWINLGTPILNTLTKSACAGLVYVLALYTVDARTRRYAIKVLRYLRARQRTPMQVEMSATGD